MMRSVAAALAMVTLAGGLSGPVSQGQRPADGTGPSMIGILVQYKSTTRTLTLATAGGQQTVVLSRTAQVRQGSRLIMANELSKHVGSKAKIRYTVSHGSLTAESVMLSVSAS